MHVWEAERRDRWFGRASRGLGVPLTVACGLAAFPRSVRCTRAQSAGASQQRASRSAQALERERYTQLREGCRKSRRGRRSTVIDELAAAAARPAARRAHYRAQAPCPLLLQGWRAWIRPRTSCSPCALDVSNGRRRAAVALRLLGVSVLLMHGVLLYYAQAHCLCSGARRDEPGEQRWLSPAPGRVQRVRPQLTWAHV